MRYVLALFVGLLAGVVAGGYGVLHNPIAAHRSLSPLAVSDRELMNLTYPAVPGDAIAFTNNGETRVEPHPEDVLQLWEPAIRKSTLMMTILYDSRQVPVGLGMKFSAQSEATRLLSGRILVDSVWHIHLPGRGSLFVDQVENHWEYLRRIVVPARLSSADSWKGIWYGDMTAGPGALGTALVTGHTGRLGNFTAEAVESLTARAYAVNGGPVSMDGQLTIELPASGDAIARQ